MELTGVPRPCDLCRPLKAFNGSLYPDARRSQKNKDSAGVRVNDAFKSVTELTDAPKTAGDRLSVTPGGQPPSTDHRRVQTRSQRRQADKTCSDSPTRDGKISDPVVGENVDDATADRAVTDRVSRSS